MNSNEEDSKPKGSSSFGTSIRDDFQGTAELIEKGWDLLRRSGGQETLIDDNLEELIGWAIHMDGPCAPKRPLSQETTTPSTLPQAAFETTSRDCDNGERNNSSTEISNLNPSHADDNPSKFIDNNGKGNQKRKRSRKRDKPPISDPLKQYASSSSNMLRSLPNIPMRPSVLQYLHDCFVETIQKDNASNQEADSGNHPCWESFDTSALVALGITVEDMLTTALLPLAEMHVHRCRQMKDQQASSEEWTLPPTEAIMKLMRTRSPSYVNPLGSLPTARMPSRRSNEVTDQDIPEQIGSAWCSRHNTDLEEVHKLWHLYRYFLPSSLEPSDTPKERARASNDAATAKESIRIEQNEELPVEDSVVVNSYAVTADDAIDKAQIEELQIEDLVGEDSYAEV